jgi:tetraacyldisaccharide 4'-kinase
MVNWFERQWATSYTVWHILLIPLSWLFAALSFARRYLYKIGWLKSYRLAVPVFVVGNINVGGTGKTPLVIWLAGQLSLAGYRPGIISRGYGGNAKQVTQVLPSTDPTDAGDEAVLIAMRTACPVFISADRVAAAENLLASFPECDVIISDDGLQHYRMQRDVEIVVYDALKGFGNGALLPAGPLRESISRLKTVDAVVCNGKSDLPKALESPSTFESFEMQLEPGVFYNLSAEHQKTDAQAFAGKKVVAIAGIGNPKRFFASLKHMGVQFEGVAYPDHYVFHAEDLRSINADIILMTEKDAVKCRAFAQSNYWVLPVNAVIKNGLMPAILAKLSK